MWILREPLLDGSGDGSDPWAARGSGRADYHRRERQRQMKNDEARPSLGAAREEFFPGV
jgi:hypothetical protein